MKKNLIHARQRIVTARIHPCRKSIITLAALAAEVFAATIIATEYASR